MADRRNRENAVVVNRKDDPTPRRLSRQIERQLECRDVVVAVVLPIHTILGMITVHPPDQIEISSRWTTLLRSAPPLCGVETSLTAARLSTEGHDAPWATSG